MPKFNDEPGGSQGDTKKGNSLPVFNKTCSFCSRVVVIEMSWEQYYELESPVSRNIQTILPDHTPAEREILISGMCDKCWNEMVVRDEEET